MDEDNNAFTGPLLPLTLIGAAAIFFLLSQLGSIHLGTQSMSWQNERADKLTKKREELQKSLTKNVEDSKANVAQSEQTQKQFTDMMKDLDELARGGDKDAEMIIKGYGIKVNDPAPGAGEKKAADKAAEKPADK